MDQQGNVGTVTKLSDTTSCWVKLDNGKNDYYLGWMLKPAGGAPAGGQQAANNNAGKTNPTNNNGGGGLANGRYECSYLGGSIVIGGGNIYIDGPSSYRGTNGASGQMQVNGSKINFTSGPLSEYGGDILAGGRIGLHTKGQTFNNMTCAPK